MKIIGDIGNTEVKICLIDNKFKIKKKIIIKTNEINQSNLSKKLKFLLKYKNSLENVVFSSVVPKIYKKFLIFFKSNLNKKIFEIKSLNLNKLIDIRVNKKQIGSDRLANSIAVISKKNNFIILDFGTATTFDVVIKNVYFGGVIAPGLNISLETLSKKAQLIPLVNLKKIRKVIGTNTVAAVRSGFFWGYIGLINNIIELIKKETRKSFKIIVTGGFSSLFKKKFQSKVFIDKDITIKGLIRTIKLIDF